MKNKLTDLNDHLFAQLERLGDEDLSAEDAEFEIKRSNAVTSIAREVISNAGLVLKAEIAFREGRAEGNQGLLLGHKPLDS